MPSVNPNYPQKKLMSFLPQSSLILSNFFQFILILLIVVPAFLLAPAAAQAAGVCTINRTGGLRDCYIFAAGSETNSACQADSVCSGNPSLCTIEPNVSNPPANCISRIGQTNVGVCEITSGGSTVCEIYNTRDLNAACNATSSRCQAPNRCQISQTQTPPSNCIDKREQQKIDTSRSGQNVVKLVNPLGGTKDKPEGRTDLKVIVGEVIQKVLTVLGSITLLVFIAGGVMWLTSGGSEEKVAKGSKTMLYAAIGIFVIFAAYAILNTVIKTLTGT